MAIIEIAKIQVRRGQENVTGEPILSPGEFGWAQDTEHLWIGKSVAEGALDNNNTRILTENDITTIIGAASTITNQQYVGHVPGRTTSPSGTVPTTAQSKFDLIVSVFDFAASNTPGTDSRGYIQNAIDQLWLDTSLVGTNLEESSRVALKIPAGRYEISGPLFLPPYATLLGEGKGKTVLVLTTSSSVSPLIQFCGGDSSPPSHNLFYPFPASSQITSASQPKYITLYGMTLQYSTTTSKTSISPLLRADCSVNSSVIDCEFVGNYNAGAADTSNSNYTGIEIRGGNGSSPARNLLIDNCVFRNTYYGVRSTYDTENTLIQNSEFKNLFRGVVNADIITSANFTGPLRTKIKNCKFVDIEHEGFYVGNNPSTTATNHISAFNNYENVGNNLLGDAAPIAPVIRFIPPTNVSIADKFSRFSFVNSTSTSITSTSSWMISGSTSVDDGVVYSSSITASPSALTLVKIPFNGFEQTVKVDYNVLKSASGIARKGQLFVNASVLAGTPSATVTDSYSYTGPNDGDLEFSATLNTTTNSVVLGYTSADSVGSITYKYSLLQ